MPSRARMKPKALRGGVEESLGASRGAGASGARTPLVDVDKVALVSTTAGTASNKRSRSVPLRSTGVELNQQLFGVRSIQVTRPGAPSTTADSWSRSV